MHFWPVDVCSFSMGTYTLACYPPTAAALHKAQQPRLMLPEARCCGPCCRAWCRRAASSTVTCQWLVMTGFSTQGPMKCIGACCTPEEHVNGASECFECHEPGDEYNLVMDMGNARSAPGLDFVPTFTTNNKRMCLLLATGQMGMLRIEDAERLQARPLPCFAGCVFFWHGRKI